jgi:hypothetical protein
MSVKGEKHLKQEENREIETIIKKFENVKINSNNKFNDKIAREL